MEGQIDAANAYLKTEDGQKIAQQSFGDNPTGDAQTDAEGAGGASFDAQGNQGAPGQFGQEGQYGAVRGKGFGGGLGGEDAAPPAQGNSQYEGYDQNDTTGEGGWQTNSGGGAFSRANQLGTDNNAPNAEGGEAPGAGHHDDGHHDGYKTGYSTPGYRKENDDEEEKARQQNRNVYGDQADDRGATGNDYNEAEI